METTTRTPVLLRLELLDRAEEALQRPVDHLDGVALGEADDDLVPLDAEVVYLLLRVRGMALLAAPTKPVAPRTLRTRCQLSSVIIILTRT